MVRAGCSKTTEELLPGVHPRVAHIRTFGCKVWAGVSDETRKTLHAKARTGVLLRILSYGKYSAIMETDETVHASQHSIVEKIVFTIQKWISIIRVSKDDVDECTADEDHSFILDDSIGGTELDLQPVPVEAPKKHEKNMKGTHQCKFLGNKNLEMKRPERGLLLRNRICED